MTTTADQQITWGAYARLSRKKPSRRRGQQQLGRHRNPDESVQRQIRLIRAYAAEHGLTLPDHLIFIDNGRSGWQKPGGPPPERPQWDRMIQAGKAGEFGGLLTWKLDRFARNTRDGQDLADLGVPLDGPNSRRMDLRNNDDLSHFNQQIETARQLSHETSEKVRAAFDDMLANGYRIGGSGRLFGFETLSLAKVDDWDDEDDEPRLLTGPAAVVREDEAGVIRELARRLLAGETVQAMADDLNRRGILTTREGQWAPRNLSRTLGNPLYGGRLTYKGEPLTTKAGDPVMLANVEPILDEDTYQAVQVKLGARKRGPRLSGKFPLSGLLDCARCPGRTMAGYTRTGGQRAYICAPANGGCGQSVIAGPVEAMVRDKALAALADTARLEAMRAADATLDAQRGKLASLMADLDTDMTGIEAKLYSIPPSQAQRRAGLERTLAGLDARHQAAGRELASLGPASVPPPPLDAVSAEEWDDPEVTPAAEKADTIRWLGLHVMIMPSTRKQGASRLPFDTGRVSIT
jgi:DNA invertase Pin-like site-specific DNA recombinase